MTCPRCDSEWTWSGIDRSCGTCGFVFTRAALDPQYAARLRAEREYESRRRKPGHTEATLRYLRELAEGVA